MNNNIGKFIQCESFESVVLSTTRYVQYLHEQNIEINDEILENYINHVINNSDLIIEKIEEFKIHLKSLFIYQVKTLKQYKKEQAKQRAIKTKEQARDPNELTYEEILAIAHEQGMDITIEELMGKPKKQ